MLRRGYDEHGSELGFVDQRRKGPSLGHRSQWSPVNGVAAGAGTFDVHEEMSIGCVDGWHHFEEATVTPESQFLESAPLESRDAENKTWRIAGAKQLDTEAFTLAPASEYENRVSFFRVLPDVEKRWECHFRYDDT